jgi:hypothetical protein
MMKIMKMPYHKFQDQDHLFDVHLCIYFHGIYVGVCNLVSKNDLKLSIFVYIY